MNFSSVPSATGCLLLASRALAEPLILYVLLVFSNTCIGIAVLVE